MREKDRITVIQREVYIESEGQEASMYRAAGEKVKTCKSQILSHQDGSEDSGTDAISHLKLSFFIGSCEVVVPSRTKHPENKQKLRKKNRYIFNY